MVRHAEALRLFTQIVVIAQVLLIAFIVQCIDRILDQFANAVCRHFMQYGNARFLQKLSALGQCVKYKRKIIQLERAFIIGTL